jgi:hypothetical protein
MNYLFYTASELAADPRPTQPYSLGAGREGSFYASKATGEWGGHPFPFSAKVKNEWICIFTSPYTVLTHTGRALLNPSLASYDRASW